MVTSWESHWDCIAGDKTYYDVTRLTNKDVLNHIQNDTETIFIKRFQGSAVKAWVGKVNNFVRIGNKQFFNVKIDKEIAVPTFANDFIQGWYLLSDEQYNASINQPVIIRVPNIKTNFIHDTTSLNDLLELPLFEILRTTNNPTEFENLTHLLLKLIGIFNIYKYPQSDQAARPDGFFKFKNLVVLYDCTLRDNYIQKKSDQISRFCDQLLTGSISYQNIQLNVGESLKQVWIITKKPICNLFKEINAVKVKEITIEKIINLYRRRMNEEFSDDDFSVELASIK
jgi:hypothetical protein